MRWILSVIVCPADMCLCASCKKFAVQCQAADDGAFYAGYSMRNLTFDLHLDWETVPVVGVLHRSRRKFGGFVFPNEYFRTNAVPRSNSAW